MRNSFINIVFCILSVLCMACSEVTDFNKKNAPELESLTVSVDGTEANVLCRLVPGSGRYTSYGLEYWKPDGERKELVADDYSPGEEFSCVIKGLDWDSDYEMRVYVCREELRYYFPEVKFRIGPDIIDDEFRDKSFLSLCVSAFDADGDGHLSRKEAGEVKKFPLRNCRTASLTDLDKFVNMDSLIVLTSRIGNLDLSGCPALVYVDASRAYLDAISFPESSHIAFLNVPDNNLSGIDLGGCPELEYLNCSNNRLTELDLSGVNNLKTLECLYVPISDVNLDSCPGLEELHVCSDSYSAVSLSFGGCTSLRILDVGTLKEEIDCSAFPALEELSLSYSPQTKLDLHANAALREVNVCDCMNLERVDVSACMNLKKATFWYTALKNLDFSGCASIEEIDCRYNKSLESVTLPQTNGVTVKKDSNTEIL